MFSGIGGFSLGLERAGFTTAAFCEIDPIARKVLKKHWPDIPIFEDVSTLKGDMLENIDVICGGFPCQDISLAGKGAGLAGKRSGLWYEFHRLIQEIKPRYAIIENVAALRSRGLEDVLRSLNEIGYDAEWHCIPASAVGAPHRRDRVWIVAYPHNSGSRASEYDTVKDGEKIIEGREEQSLGWLSRCCEAVADTNGSTNSTSTTRSHTSESEKKIGNRKNDLSTRDITRASDAIWGNSLYGYSIPNIVANSLFEGLEGQRTLTSRIGEELENARNSCWWSVEPNVGRAFDGFSGWLDRNINDIVESHKCIIAYVINNNYGVLDVAEKKARTAEILQSLRDSIREEIIQQQVRGFGCISQTEVLLSYLCKLEEREIDQTWLQLESEEISKDFMRSLWNFNQPTRTSHKSEKGSEYGGEYTNSLQALSRFLAFNAEKAWVRYRREDATINDWCGHWEDGITRVANGVPGRVDRLKQLGNAVVPQIPQIIGEAIMLYENDRG